MLFYPQIFTHLVRQEERPANRFRGEVDAAFDASTGATIGVALKTGDPPEVFSAIDLPQEIIRGADMKT